MSTVKSKNAPLLYTIGHSTRSLEDMVAILQSFHIKKLMDIRTIPKSKFNPQSNKEVFAKNLPLYGIEYEHLAGMGGLRRAKKDSVNAGWRNASFRGYADYMQTEDFKGYLKQLLTQAAQTPIAIMCAEALPWRCLRSLVADAAIIHGFEVINIMGPAKGSFHALNPMAKVKGDKIYYPKEPHDKS